MQAAWSVGCGRSRTPADKWNRGTEGRIPQLFPGGATTNHGVCRDVLCFRDPAAEGAVPWEGMLQGVALQSLVPFCPDCGQLLMHMVDTHMWWGVGWAGNIATWVSITFD